jgi:hypothetical protein
MLKTPRQYGRPIPEAVNRRAERRWAQRPFAKGARTPAKACILPGANRRSAPRLARGKACPREGGGHRLAKGGKHDGHRGADQRPRRISHGCMTSESDESERAESRGDARRSNTLNVVMPAKAGIQ